MEKGGTSLFFIPLRRWIEGEVARFDGLGTNKWAKMFFLRSLNIY
jgi:hypothetical protein